MRCGGWGEQWACFVIGILIWPLWWVASVAVEGWQVAQGAWLEGSNAQCSRTDLPHATATSISCSWLPLPVPQVCGSVLVPL